MPLCYGYHVTILESSIESDHRLIEGHFINANAMLTSARTQSSDRLLQCANFFERFKVRYNRILEIAGRLLEGSTKNGYWEIDSLAIPNALFFPEAKKNWNLNHSIGGCFMTIKNFIQYGHERVPRYFDARTAERDYLREGDY